MSCPHESFQRMTYPMMGREKYVCILLLAIPGLDAFRDNTEDDFDELRAEADIIKDLPPNLTFNLSNAIRAEPIASSKRNDVYIKARCVEAADGYSRVLGIHPEEILIAFNSTEQTIREAYIDELLRYCKGPIHFIEEPNCPQTTIHAEKCELTREEVQAIMENELISMGRYIKMIKEEEAEAEKEKNEQELRKREREGVV